MGFSIALVGCGAMGSALLKGWLTLPDTKERFANFWVIAPHREKVEPFLKDTRVGWISSPEQLPQTPDLILFAVKPYHLEDILPHYKAFETLFISVASGKPLSFYETYLSLSSPLGSFITTLHFFNNQNQGLLQEDPTSRKAWVLRDHE